MDTNVKETTQHVQPDSPGRKAALFLERAEARIKRHQKQLGDCSHFPFENCPECGGEDLRQDLLALYTAAA